ALDLTPNPSSVDFAAEQIVEEMFRRGPVEVGITKNGLTRLSLLKTAIPERGSRDVLNGEDLLLITGGGRGVTAEAAISIARAFRPKIILVGRTRLDNDSPLWLKGISDERDIKKAIAKNSNGHKPTPKYVDETYKRILAVREVTRTLQRIREAGSEVHYISTDITDRRVFQQVLTDVKERFGPLTGVLHGAGVLFDKRIEDKTSEQFEKVFETKVSSLSTILSSIDTEKLKTLVLFSSFTGRYGRIGQLDYGVANEVLNKIAQSQARVLKRCRVISLNWGPWDGGMVTPALKKIFQKEGVGLISLQAGAEYLVKEIASTGDRSVEIVVLGGKNSGPTEQPQRKAVSAEASPNTMKRAFRFDLEMGRFPFLKSHVLDGKPVLPMAMMIEWCANAALHENPGLHFSGFNNFRVLKGVVLEPQCLGSIEIWTGQPEKEGKWFLVPVEIRGIGEGSPSVFHAKGEFVLSGLLKEEPFSVEVQKGRLANYDESLIYSERLFHGKEFRGIVEMEECSHAGVQVLVKSAPPPSDWIAKPVRNSWVTDPLVIDSSFQAMILWTLDMYDTDKSLPCFVGKYRQYQARFPQNGVRVKAEVLTSSEAFAQADIFFVDERNRCIAKIEKYECTLSRLLKKAFNGR
ncbi:MAG: SDR family NAD(P)-dependent oxidoreductase, partial [Nitrospinota bacterium]